MGRSQRVTQPGLVYHVLNRRVMRLPLFEKEDDYLALEQVGRVLPAGTRTRANAVSDTRPPPWRYPPKEEKVSVRKGKKRCQEDFLDVLKGLGKIRAWDGHNVSRRPGLSITSTTALLTSS